MPLKGSGECFLEIELCPSGDFNLGMRGQDTRGEIHYISSQIPNSGLKRIGGASSPVKLTLTTTEKL